MKMKALIAFFALVVLFIGCASNDPSGHLTQATGELQYGRSADALISAARHSEKACTDIADQLYSKLGKKRVCQALTEATDRMYKESQTYRDAGNLVEADKAKDAHRRLYNIKFNYCR